MDTQWELNSQNYSIDPWHEFAKHCTMVSVSSLCANAQLAGAVEYTDCTSAEG